MSSTELPTGRPLRLAVTRAAGTAGGVLTEALAAEGDAVVALVPPGRPGPAVSPRPGAGPVRTLVVDIATPAVVAALDEVDVLVHVVPDLELAEVIDEQAASRRSRLLAEATTLLTACAAADVRHLVLVTSAGVLGARADNPVPLPEGTHLRSEDREGLVADLLAVEQGVAALAPALPGLRVTVLRPALLVGPGVDTTLTRHFEAPRLLVLRGTVPAWQLLHVEDLASALLVVARGDLPSEVAAAAPGWLSQEEVERHSGMRRIELAPVAAHAAADRLHRLGVVPGPASDLAYVSHPWAVEPRALLAAGWAPRYDNAACVRALAQEVRGHHALMARRLRSRDAALGAAAGAASAAVAVAASTALARRRRRDP